MSHHRAALLFVFGLFLGAVIGYLRGSAAQQMENNEIIRQAIRMPSGPFVIDNCEANKLRPGRLAP